jgi:hypothetical protein
MGLLCLFLSQAVGTTIAENATQKAPCTLTTEQCRQKEQASEEDLVGQTHGEFDPGSG